MANQNQLGLNVIGNFKGYFEKENDGYTNRFIAIVAGTYENEYQEVEENVIKIEVPKNREIEFKDTEAMIGKLVKINIAVNLKSGVSKRNSKPYAFNTFYPRKDAKLELITGK